MPKVELPDFEDMQKIIAEIRDLQLRELRFEIVLKRKEAEVYIETSKNPKYFINDKPPSATFVKSTYEFTGLSNELLKIRAELAKVQAELDYKRNLFYLMKDMIDVWRTVSANERQTLL
jgi:hypothetical protein